MKTWLPAGLVRDMDQTILATSGAYNGRDDFIREAIADRLAEERSRPDKGTAPVLLLHASIKGEKKTLKGAVRQETRSRRELRETESGWAATPTLPPHDVAGTLYGLHNRDYPTLWVARALLKMASEKGAPLAWSGFVSAVLDAAWNIGAQLARMDVERGPNEQKGSVGFPTNSEKRKGAEARFLEHMVGVPDREGGPTGPLFAMKLAGTKRETAAIVVAPTREAGALWTALASAGFAAKERPPHPAEAWLIFREHLRSNLPDDYDAWIRVLRGIGEGRTRDDLIAQFTSEWAGAAAATNVAGYISRGREWGLVDPKLKDRQYMLTDLGRGAVEQRGGR